MKNTNNPVKLPRGILKAWNESDTIKKAEIDAILADKNNSDEFFEMLMSKLKFTDLPLGERMTLAYWMIEG